MALLRERGNERRDRSGERRRRGRRAAGGRGFRLVRIKRKTTTEKTVEACSRAGMRTKLKLGRVCRLVASWQAQARRGETLRGAAKTVTRREARRGE